MIKRLKNLFKDPAGEDAPGHETDIAMTVASLMIEVMVMDGRLDQAEHDVISHLLQQRFDLSVDEIEQLIRDATVKADQAHDLYQFTSRIIKAYPINKRTDIIRELWRVAMADGHADAYEEQLIRRIAELIGVHHHHFIDAKIQAREES